MKNWTAYLTSRSRQSTPLAAVLLPKTKNFWSAWYVKPLYRFTFDVLHIDPPNLLILTYGWRSLRLR